MLFIRCKYTSVFVLRAGQFSAPVMCTSRLEGNKLLGNWTNLNRMWIILLKILWIKLLLLLIFRYYSITQFDMVRGFKGHPAPCYLNSGDVIFIIWRDWYCSPEQDSNLGPEKPYLHLRAIISDLDHSATTTSYLWLLIFTEKSYSEEL